MQSCERVDQRAADDGRDNLGERVRDIPDAHVPRKVPV